MSHTSPTHSRPRQVIAPSAPLRRKPAADAPLETELLFGEIFYLYEEENGWAKGQAGFDSYVGFVEMPMLGKPAGEATHRVAALRTYRFSEPDLKSAPLGLISMNAKMRIEDSPSGKFVRDPFGGWIYVDHLLPIEARAEDYIDVAERFLGTPYYWGGRTSLGLDCSALVQNALERAGIAVPRDSADQQSYFRQHGQVLFPTEGSDDPWENLNLARGDLVFWKGHVGIMTGDALMVHANATHMAVTIDDVRSFAARIKDREGNVTLVARPAV